MKTIIALSLAMLSLPAFADDSYNKGFKVECLMQRAGPAVEVNGQLVIKDVKKVQRAKSSVMVTKRSAQLFSGKTIIGGWEPYRTDIDNGTGFFKNRMGDVYMQIDRDGEYSVEIITPDGTLTQGYNCNFTWYEN